MKKLKELYFKLAKWLSDKTGIAQDKWLHFIGGFVISIVGMILFNHAPFAFLLAILVGLAKELMDDFIYGGFDFLDWLATVLGGSLILLLLLF